MPEPGPGGGSLASVISESVANRASATDSARPGAAGSVPRLPPPRPAALGQLELRQTRDSSR